METSNTCKRGRPAGRTAEGEATRTRIYETAVALIGERGYEAATLRNVAERAGVSPGLLYRYFPSKRAVVLALYDRLSLEFADRASAMPKGKWRDRFSFVMALSLEVLWPHRVTLQSLVPVIVGDAEEGIFAEGTAFSRERVQAAFVTAVEESTDAPKIPLARSLGRLLYLAHLGVILWWLLDRSLEQRATRGLVALLGRILALIAPGLRLPPVRDFVLQADDLFAEGLVGKREAAG